MNPHNLVPVDKYFVVVDELGPTNSTATKDGSGASKAEEEYFDQPEVLERVPHVLLYLAVMYCALMGVGSALIGFKPPSQRTSSAEDVSEKEAIVSSTSLTDSSSSVSDIRSITLDTSNLKW